MKRYSFYHKDTGVFATHWYSATVPELEANTPADHVAIEGKFHPLSHKFDLTKKEVTQADSPGADHVWDEEAGKWAPGAELLGAMRGESAYRSRLADLHEEERRATRAAVLGDAAARERLQEIHTELEGMRPNGNGKQAGK